MLLDHAVFQGLYSYPGKAHSFNYFIASYRDETYNKKKGIN